MTDLGKVFLLVDKACSKHLIAANLAHCSKKFLKLQCERLIFFQEFVEVVGAQFSENAICYCLHIDVVAASV